MQAQLAYYTGKSLTLDERNAARQWRQYCNSLEDMQQDGWVDTKVDQAKRLIRQRRDSNDKTAINALINSGALEILVNDWTLRAEGDAAAHPGLLKQDDVGGYRAAIHAIGNEEHEKYLTGCIAYLSDVGKSSESP